MIYTLKNEFLTVKIDTAGAELRSVLGADGTEYMWQRDSRYWGDSAPWLFPICSNLDGSFYTYEGKKYEMGSHGFAHKCTFVAEDVSDTALTMVLAASDETKGMYPFDFLLEITYRLVGNRLSTLMTATNRDGKVMPVAMGGHPGFSVPLGGDGTFDDWKLVFNAPSAPRTVVFTEDMLDSGERAPYALEGGTTLPLSRGLFAIDGIFFSDMPSAVTLCSDKSTHAVTVEYGDARYLGVWSESFGGDFVCVEPWYGMASRKGVTALEEKSDMIKLAPGAGCEMRMDITFH